MIPLSVRNRYQCVVDEVAEVCEQCGRAPSEVRVVAVSKTVGPDEVVDAAAGGAVDFGENRPDQLAARADQFPALRWHFIGNIQSRRIPEIVGAAFRGLATLADEIRATLAPDEAAAFTELSMGMSEDWPCAIACGATIVRIGRAIFSESFEE